MQITQAEQKAIFRASANALSYFEEGEDPREVLSQIYCHNMEDKSPHQGAMMAKELMTWMARFQRGFDAAIDDPEGYAYNELKSALAGMPEERREELLQEWLMAADCLNSQKCEEDSENAFAAQKENSACNGKEPGLCPETLLKTLVLRIKFAPRALQSILKGEAAWTPRERVIVEMKCGRNMDLAVTAMVIYTMAKNGQLSGLPQDITLGEVAVGVCAADLQQELAMQQSVDDKTAERQQLALKITVVVLMAAASAALLIGGAVLLNPIVAYLGVVMAQLTVVMAAHFKNICRISENSDTEISPLPLKLQNFLHLQPKEDREEVEPKLLPKHQPSEESDLLENYDVQPLGF